ncbi:hypothetical protein E1B28_011958 [Marasmius oreades]|uniref:3-oxo-5-alpha-steroid 4-dehydrogenase C-terminal domain-containing protein n=1 Tax=Marasmius oreades TaxID=181124 RepID=A0A9P7RQK7_9AGAR|nr:uncharacterized protein E1B28_011958 [Marasmius oreades]KAG7087909.1 hypothetical protein E1B28_011958 [Marasmius oreades]
MSLSELLSEYISVPQARHIYDSTRKNFILLSIAAFVATFKIDAQFGRFSRGDGPMYVNAKIAWMIMEIFSPICCTLSFLAAPLSMPVLTPTSQLPLYPGQKVLLGLFLVHYGNRAIISPLRTPSRSKAHISVPFASILFNVVNGSLMGTYLNSPQARIWLAGKEKEWWWWAAITLWAAGFVGNIAHDEILFNLRRKTKGQSDKKNDDAKPGQPKQQGEHYAIPYGLLYKYITFPNYFCEWLEWLGFAIAASPVPISLSTLLHMSSPAAIANFPNLLVRLPSILRDFIQTPPMFFMGRFTPPWIFLLNEVLVMLPRAYRGHLWYKEKFGDAYPKERKIVVPGLL